MKQVKLVAGLGCVSPAMFLSPSLLIRLTVLGGSALPCRTITLLSECPKNFKNENIFFGDVK